MRCSIKLSMTACRLKAATIHKASREQSTRKVQGGSYPSKRVYVLCSLNPCSNTMELAVLPRRNFAALYWIAFYNVNSKHNKQGIEKR